MEILRIPALRSPRMLLAFGGWNDAGEAATAAVSHLLSLNASEANSEIAIFDPEDYYDFQVNRPLVSSNPVNGREINWPTTRVYGLATPKYPFDLVLVTGPEPSMKWKSFAHELLDLGDDLDVSLIISLGSLLADIPHTRPISVTASGATPDLANRLGVMLSDYQGPTGILGVVQDAAMRRGIDAVSLWAAIPHYASITPSPKATLALINALEDFLDVSIPQADLPDMARSWEIAVDELANEDSDIAEYVKQLEASRDEADLPEATGDSIARDFERYLRRKESE
jgi:proteasome assembly chaperone (PAC2) family protein